MCAVPPPEGIAAELVEQEVEGGEVEGGCKRAIPFREPEQGVEPAAVAVGVAPAERNERGVTEAAEEMPVGPS